MMFGWDFVVDPWSRFWKRNLIKICVRTTQPSGPLCLWQCLCLSRSHGSGSSRSAYHHNPSTSQKDFPLLSQVFFTQVSLTVGSYLSRSRGSVSSRWTLRWPQLRHRGVCADCDIACNVILSYILEGCLILSYLLPKIVIFIKRLQKGWLQNIRSSQNNDQSKDPLKNTHARVLSFGS